MTPTVVEAGADASRGPRSVGRVAALSLVGSLVAAFGAVAFLVPGGEEPVVTGAVMVALGMGWAALAVLSTRVTDEPQPWAFVPATYLLLGGGLLLGFRPESGTMEILGWIWPPVLLAVAVWTIGRARRQLRGRTRKTLVYPMCGLLALAAVGGGFATLSEAINPVAAPASGELIDIGGRRLYIECTGSGTPTVVLEAGLWASSADWDPIATAVAEQTTVCAYDRAGRGYSDPPGSPQDGLAIAADLHSLLAAAGVDGPVVLVGHSSGGVYARVYASEYPDDVAGMVLLDAQPVAAFTRLPSYPGFYRRTKVVAGLLPMLARMGVVRIADAHSMRDEFIALPDALDQGAALNGIGDRPLIVVTAARGALEGWMPLQEEMVALSTNSSHRVVSTASHDSLVSDEDDATAATDAILDVVMAVRTATPLTNP